MTTEVLRPHAETVRRRAGRAGRGRRPAAPAGLAAVAAGGGDLPAGRRPGREITPKYIGPRRLMEVAVATLATDRALLLLGVPGTAKTWVSEHLAAAISGDSTLLVQGTAGTPEEAIRYGWNYARLLAEGPSEAALVPSPVMRAMADGAIARVEELTRMPSDVQDTLITILSEKTLPVPELGDGGAGPQGLQRHRHRQRPRPGRQRAVQRAAPAVQHGGAAGAGHGRGGGRHRRPAGSRSSAARWSCPSRPTRWTRSAGW